MHKLFAFLLGITVLGMQAQEFSATVGVNAEQTGNPNLQVFKTLERSLTEFINNNKWTENEYRTEERIKCSFFINIQSFTNDSFVATLQVQASRPVFESNYETTILNVNDKQFAFTYLEFQPLNYNPNSFDTNLVSVVAFYLYTILGVEADTFELNSGTSYYEEAKNIVGNAQGSGGAGWSAIDGPQSRFKFNDDMLSGTFDGYRQAMYSYHREGLDVMGSDLKKGKDTIIESLNSLEKMNQTRPNSYMMRVFFDAKADEIAQILSGGPNVNLAQAKVQLRKIAPTYSSNWESIKL